MTDPSDAAAYNIERYTASVNRHSREAFRSSSLRVGAQAPDLPLWNAEDGRPTTVAALRREAHLFLVFGCWTAPPCIYEVGAIDALATSPSTAAQGARVVFVYTREIHPAERLPAHRSMEEKVARATHFKESLGLRLRVVVDDLVGTAHRTFGGLPFMAIGIARDGTIVHRAEWVSVAHMQAAIENLALRDSRRREGAPGRLFYSEMLGYLPGFDEVQLRAALAVAGPSAVEDTGAMPAPRPI